MWRDAARGVVDLIVAEGGGHRTLPPAARGRVVHLPESRKPGNPFTFAAEGEICLATNVSFAPVG